AGALWHTLFSEVVAGRGHRLPLLAEYLSYAVLAPFIGATEALAAVVRSRPATAAVEEVGERGARERGDHDHDDQRRVARAEDPVDLDRLQVEHGEQRGE